MRLAPPNKKNPNLFPIGNAFGFFIFIKDISYRCLSPEDFLSSGFFFYLHIRFLLFLLLQWLQKGTGG